MWSRQIRWARLRRVTFPLYFVPEIFSGMLVPCLLAALAIGSSEMALGLCLMVAVTYGGEVALAVRAGWLRSPALLAAFIARDLLIPFIWTMAWMRSDVVWRGNAMAIETKPSRVRTA